MAEIQSCNVLLLTYEAVVAFYARTYSDPFSAPPPPRVPLTGWNWAEFHPASARAEAAFQRHLTPSQRYYWKRWRWCWVTAPSGRLYRIKNEWYWNIVEYEGEKPKSRWCLSTHVDCPIEDRYLTQLLYLRYNEAKFRKVANEDCV